MKTLDWKGPDLPIWGGLSKISISDHMDRLHHEKHAKFQDWQAAITMNMIFGDNYVTVPPIPAGYEAYAKHWYDNELKAVR